MRHRILTCKNHPELRWGCKDIAWSQSDSEGRSGGYNGARQLFYKGVPSGRGMYADGSGLDCTLIHPETGAYMNECACPVSDLVLAPEDSLVTGA